VARLRIIVVMPAYNAARTLRMTYAALPHDVVDRVILVDDGSSDETIAVARELGLTLFIHGRNYGYGANQKTCYREALKAGADVVAMVHPDYQYDPSLLPTLVAPIASGEADVTLGSRLMGMPPVAQGMPWWKYLANRALTGMENAVFGLRLSEYHTGYRAYSRATLEALNFEMNSDRFIFDQEIVAQAVAIGLRIAEVPVPTRYFPEASSASFAQSTLYGFSILRVLAQFVGFRLGWRQKRYDSLTRRYRPDTDDGRTVGSNTSR
jgi:glycosyltransferase involved in cell wall biosynthesis